MIVAVNPSTPIALANHLATSGPELVKDAFDGTLFGRATFPPDPPLARSLESDGAENLKRVRRPADEDWLKEPSLSRLEQWV